MTIPLNGSSLLKVGANDSPDPNTLVGPCTFTYTSLESGWVAWQRVQQ